VWILTDIEWRNWCEECVEEEFKRIRDERPNDIEYIMDCTEEFLLGPKSVRGSSGELLPTYGVRYPR
jgi:hypothetical protein